MAPFRFALVTRVAALAVLVLAGCTTLPSVTAPSFHADALVPSDTWSFTDVTLRPSVQQALYLREVSDLFVGAGADLHHVEIRSGETVDFETDVLPYLDGEIAVAVDGPVDTPTYMVMVHTSDVERILRLGATEADPHFTRDARGALHYDPHQDSSVVVAYKNWVIYASTSALADQTLDRIDGKGGPNLAHDARYHSVVDRLSGDRLGYGYLDAVPLLKDAAATQPANPAFEAGGRAAYSLGFETGPDAGVWALGMRLEYIPDVNVSQGHAGGGDALQAMDRLPRASMVAFAGSDLGQYAQSLALLSDTGDVPAEVQALLDQLAGPYAVGITSPGPGDRTGAVTLGNFIGGVFALAQLKPDAKADQVSAALTSVADSLAQSDQSDAWDQQVVVADNWVALNAVPAPATLDQLPEDLLASDRTYQWARHGFSDNGTNSYVNINALLSTIAGQFQLSSPDLDPLRPLQALGTSVQTDANGDGHAHVQLLIAAP